MPDILSSLQCFESYSAIQQPAAETKKGFTMVCKGTGASPQPSSSSQENKTCDAKQQIHDDQSARRELDQHTAPMKRITLHLFSAILALGRERVCNYENIPDSKQKRGQRL
jgi:hypothetical protein